MVIQGILMQGTTGWTPAVLSLSPMASSSSYLVLIFSEDLDLGLELSIPLVSPGNSY